ncbi:MAG: A/G-specific adenine glycosylase [Oscillospiraceae bacterium]|nr:A/G-specific adenine glycosylase [Oscillospiraceae bacterium]
MLDKLPELLLPWYKAHKRDLPWRRDREPYHVWLSEIMLQQTRVEAVKGYYRRFLEALPDVESLAHAPEDQLTKLWEGLGYYSRVRNLQKAAKQILELGSFPRDQKGLLSLGGIGPYTAGAIASICFEQPAPAVDGNVIRVLSRLLARTVDPKEAGALLQPLYPEGHCGDFTQALMELGATVCLPNGEPNCENCPLCPLCEARKEGAPRAYPQRAEKKPRRVEQRTVFLLQCGEEIAVCKRPRKGLLAGLWQLPDTAGHLDLQQAVELVQSWGIPVRETVMELQRSHIFTHVHWELRGIYLRCGEKNGPFRWVSPTELEEEIGLPTAYRQFLDVLQERR